MIQSWIKNNWSSFHLQKIMDVKKLQKLKTNKKDIERKFNHEQNMTDLMCEVRLSIVQDCFSLVMLSSSTFKM